MVTTLNWLYVSNLSHHLPTDIHGTVPILIVLVNLFTLHRTLALAALMTFDVREYHACLPHRGRFFGILEFFKNASSAINIIELGAFRNFTISEFLLASRWSSIIAARLSLILYIKAKFIATIQQRVEIINI